MTSLADTARQLAAAGDANARVHIPLDVGVGRWDRTLPRRMKRHATECGLDSVNIAVRTRYPVITMTVSAEGPAPAALALVETITDIVAEG